MKTIANLIGHINAFDFEKINYKLVFENFNNNIFLAFIMCLKMLLYKPRYDFYEVDYDRKNIIDYLFETLKFINFTSPLLLMKTISKDFGDFFYMLFEYSDFKYMNSLYFRDLNDTGGAIKIYNFICNLIKYNKKMLLYINCADTFDMFLKKMDDEYKKYVVTSSYLR